MSTRKPPKKVTAQAPVTEGSKKASRYQIGDTDLECIDVIVAMGDGVGFCRGNAEKYIIRSTNAETLDKAAIDWKKAHHYLGMLIENTEVFKEQEEKKERERKNRIRREKARQRREKRK